MTDRTQNKKKVKVETGDIYAFHPPQGDTLETWIDPSTVEIDVVGSERVPDEPGGEVITVIGWSFPKIQRKKDEALKEIEDSIIWENHGIMYVSTENVQKVLDEVFGGTK